MTTHREFKSTAQRKTIDHRDHRFIERFNAAHHVAAALAEVATFHRRQTIHFGDVGAGDKCLRPSPCQNRHPHLVVGGNFGERRIQLPQRFGVQRIQLVRPINRNFTNGAKILDQKVGIRHLFRLP